jgi:hypothetical protein
MQNMMTDQMAKVNSAHTKGNGGRYIVTKKTQITGIQNTKAFFAEG